MQAVPLSVLQLPRVMRGNYMAQLYSCVGVAMESTTQREAGAEEACGLITLGLVVKIKVSTGLAISGGVRKNLFHACLLAPAGLLAIFGIGWLIGASPCSRLSSSRCHLPVHRCVQIPPLTRTPALLH